MQVCGPNSLYTTREVQNNSNLTVFNCTLQVAMPPGNWQKQIHSPVGESSFNLDSKHYWRQQTETGKGLASNPHKIKCTSSINRKHRKSCSLTRSNQRYANNKTWYHCTQILTKFINLLLGAPKDVGKLNALSHVANSSIVQQNIYWASTCTWYYFGKNTESVLKFTL